MERLTSILAVIQDVDVDAAVLDKSATLARAFHARLELLVRQPVQSEACVARCAVHGLADVDTSGMNDERLSDAVLRRLGECSFDLVIKRLSPESMTRRFWLATDDSALAAACPAPLMLMRDRAWSAEPRFAAAVDISDPDTEALARGIMHAGGFLALGCEAWLDILYTEREQHDERIRMERAVRLARLVREFHVGGERLQVFDGAPEKTLTALTRARNYDVLVLGATSRRNVLRSTFGTLTSALVDATSGDVLLVKATPSAGEQLVHQRQQYA